MKWLMKIECLFKQLFSGHAGEIDNATGHAKSLVVFSGFGCFTFYVELLTNEI